MITLTPDAIKEIERLLEEKRKEEKFDEKVGLRVGVKGGGCSGLSYTLNFDTPREKDNIFEFEDVRVLVDPKSLLYLEGMALDFSNSLEGRGFKFINPNASKTCGCGESFST